MKKLVCSLLILSALLSLSGCSELLSLTTGGTSGTSGTKTSGSTLSANESTTPVTTVPGSTDTAHTSSPTTDPESDPEPVFTEVPDFSGRGATILSFTERLPDEIASFVDHYAPDVFTLSGASSETVETLANSNPDYAYIGTPSGDGGEIQTIFYRTDRLEVVKSATIWLSATPSTQSAWEGADGFHTCTYALFSDRESSDSFAVFTAVLDENETVREKEIISLYQKYACYKDYFPTVVTGDLKVSGEGDAGYAVLTAGGGLTHLADNLFSVCMEKSFVSTVSKDEKAGGTYGQLIYGETPYKLDLTKKLVALTFDDGPRMDSVNHAYTDAVLKALADHACKATFFVVGERLKSSGQADLLKQEFAAGHEIGNHTYSHVYYSSLSADQLLTELAKTDDLVRSLTGGIPTTLLRAPGGINKPKATLTLPLVNWSLDTEDWNSSAGVTPSIVLSTVKTNLREGDIVLMHDLWLNSPSIMDELLGWMEENGYQTVTVRELFEFSDIRMDSGKVYYSTTKIKDVP
ncbi:MAG: polysaccharide deacetylase family protein [Eubacteriales bacterium]